MLWEQELQRQLADVGRQLQAFSTVNRKALDQHAKFAEDREELIRRKVCVTVVEGWRGEGARGAGAAHGVPVCSAEGSALLRRNRDTSLLGRWT